MPSSCTDEEFTQLFRDNGAAKVAKRLGITQRAVYARRKAIEDRTNRSIAAPGRRSTRVEKDYPARATLTVGRGCVLVGSDAHIWPGNPSTAWRAFVAFAAELKPRAIILNGDVLDFSQISRHPPIGWEKRPSVVEEIEVTQERLHQLELAAGPGVEKIWPLGNHDARFETRLATLAPEYAKVAGVHLVDHFPNWVPAWSAWINNDVVVKHRFKGGVHATHNNTMHAGKSMVTGHLHSAKVTPLTDYNGTRYGVDTGCLADPAHEAFVDWTEDNPLNWRSGFAVLSFEGGKLLPPELVSVWDAGSVVFRGKIIAV